MQNSTLTCRLKLQTECSFVRDKSSTTANLGVFVPVERDCTEGTENIAAGSKVITHFERVFVERDCTEHSVADNKAFQLIWHVQ